MKKIFQDKEFLHKLFGLAMPIALQALLLSCVGASDTIMLGSLDQNSMAAVSLATQIQFVQNVTMSGVVAAFIILGSQYWGKEDLRTVSKLFFMSLKITVAVSVIFSGLCFCVPELLMKIFTNEPVLAEIGAGYLRIAAVSYLLTGFSQCLIALLKVGERASSVAKISGAAVFLNIGLNAVFIFGLCGAPAMGAEGAALATAIARVVELIWAAVSCFRDRKLRPDFRLISEKLPKAISSDFVRQLIPLMGAYMIWTFGFTAYSAFMGHMGVDAAAANSVASVIRSLVSSFIRGLASGGSILVGNELGAGNLNRARIYGDRLLVLSLICGLFCAGLLFVILPGALALVHLSSGAKEVFYGMMAVLAAYMVGSAYNSVAINGMFAAGGDTMFDLISLIITMWCIAVPLAALGTFVFHWPPVLVYACTCLDEIGKIPWVVIHYRKYRWVKDLTR